MNGLIAYRMSWILVVLLGIVPHANAQVEIDTRAGNGADSEIANDNSLFGAGFADETRGTLQPNSMNTRFSLLGGQFAERHRASMMRFDISGVSGDVSGAGLLVHSVDQSRTVEVYGLNDSNEAGIEDWDETTITYNNAPGITNLGPETVAGVVDPAFYSLLGTWIVPGPRSGDGFPFSDVSTTFPEPVNPEPETQYTDPADLGANFSTNLSDLVAADTNDLITLLFFPTETQTNGNVALRTKEWEFMNDGMGNLVPRPEFVIAPTLVLPNAQEGNPIREGDFNEDGFVDGDDFLIWQSGFNQFEGDAAKMDGDANADGFVDGNDFLIWQSQFGSGSGSASAAVPEPTSVVLLLVAFVGVVFLGRRH